MWAHQYDQQPNQVLCSLRPRQWTTNGPESNLFGLEPNFGCCTVQLPSGLAEARGEPVDGDARRRPGRRRLRPERGEDDGGAAASPVTVVEETEYPFRETSRLPCRPARRRPFRCCSAFPRWASGDRDRVNGEPQDRASAPARFIESSARGSPGDRVVARVCRCACARRAGSTTRSALERGPLVYLAAHRRRTGAR